MKKSTVFYSKLFRRIVVCILLAVFSASLPSATSYASDLEDPDPIVHPTN